MNHLYLKGLSEWTALADLAKNFPSSERAIAYCSEHRIPAVRVVLKFDSDKYDIQVPITEECKDAAPPQNTLPK
jgi:hypothetical protein